MLSKVFSTWILGDIYTYIYIYFHSSTFFVLNISLFSACENAPLRKSSGVSEPPGAKGLHVLFSLFFSKFEKKSACRQLGFLHQSGKDMSKIAGCRERDRGGRKGEEKKRDSRRKYAEAKVPSRSVNEFRNSGCALVSSMAACQSWICCSVTKRCCILATSLIFFASSEI